MLLNTLCIPRKFRHIYIQEYIFTVLYILYIYQQSNYTIYIIYTGFSLDIRFHYSITSPTLNIFVIWGPSFLVFNPQKSFFPIIISYYNNKFILFRVIFLSDIKITSNHSYLYYQNIIPLTYYIISKSVFHCTHCI